MHRYVQTSVQSWHGNVHTKMYTYTPNKNYIYIYIYTHTRGRMHAQTQPTSVKLVGARL